MNKTVYCPVIKDQIDGTSCLEICIVADGEIRSSVLSPEIEWNEKQREICLACKYHAEIQEDDNEY